MVHALRIPQQILHGLHARRLERRGVPRAGRAADDGHDGPSDGGLPGVRHVVQGRKGLPGLLLGLSGQVRRPCRGHGHGAYLGGTLHVPRRRRAYPVESGRGAYQRVGRNGAPGERHGDRGHEVAGDVLLQCAEGFPGVLRAARFEDSECRRLLEEATEDDGRGGGVDAGQREV